MSLIAVQVAYIDGKWKMVVNPEKGQCDTFLPPWNTAKNLSKPLLFNLETDPTESQDLSMVETERYEAMMAAMNNWTQGILYSQVHESACAAPSPSPPSPSPLPPTPPATGHFVKNGTSCLTLTSADPHTPIQLGSCGGGSKWNYDSNAKTVRNVATELYIKADSMGSEDACHSGNEVFTGKLGQHFITFADERLFIEGCQGKCVLVSTTGASVSDCSNATYFKLA